MTPAERALYDRIRRRAAGLAPHIARRQAAAYKLIRGVLTEAELLRGLRFGLVDQLILQLLPDRTLDPLFQGLRSYLDVVVLDSARLAHHLDIPTSLQPDAFDTLNPRVIDAARALDTRVIQGLKDEVRETFRQTAIEGLEAGIHPRTVARRVRSTLGLAPNQQAAVANFRRMLEEGDRTALRRQLRDRRFDRTLQKALGKKGSGLSADQVERMVEAYNRRMIAFNAETHSRTAALDAQKLGQRLSWEDAIAQGTVDRDRLRKTWRTVGDSRVRPEHEDMEGEEVGFDEAFSNGQYVPGDTDYNCRCWARYTVARAALRVAA